MFGDDVVAVAGVAPKPTGSLGRERVLASMTLRSTSSFSATVSIHTHMQASLFSFR